MAKKKSARDVLGPGKLADAIDRGPVPKDNVTQILNVVDAVNGLSGEAQAVLELLVESRIGSSAGSVSRVLGAIGDITLLRVLLTEGA